MQVDNVHTPALAGLAALGWHWPLRRLDGVYERLDLAIYSPLCLLLAAGSAAVARRPSP